MSALADICAYLDETLTAVRAALDGGTLETALQLPIENESDAVEVDHRSSTRA